MKRCSSRKAARFPVGLWIVLAALPGLQAAAQQAAVENLRLLQSGPSPQRLSFAWDAPLSGPADHYQVYLNGDFQGTVEWTSWVDGNLLPASSYTLTVRAVNAAGEISEARTVTQDTLAIPALQPAIDWNTVLVRYADYPDEPFTAAEASSWMYGATGSVNAYFSEVSYGRTSITGVVKGWYTLPNPASYYHTRGENNGWWWGPDLGLILADLDAIDPNTAGAEGRVLILHGTGDAGAAAGTVKRIAGRLGQACIGTIIHELGHSFSNSTAHLGHPGGWLSPVASVGPSLLNPRAGGCEAWIYGYEPFDPMGFGTRHFMAYHKWLMGMIDANQVVVAEEGVEYDLGALEVMGGVKMLRIPIDTEYFYCVEYRKPVGLDGADLYPGSNNNKQPVDGVLVRVRMQGPGVFPTLIPYPAGQTINPLVCNPGTPFEDPYRGYRVEVVSKAGDTARVRFVRLPRCPAKLVSIDPDVAAGQVSVAWRAEQGATVLIERSTDLEEWVALNRGYPYAPYPEEGMGSDSEAYTDRMAGPVVFYRVRRR